jgi:hypothetical protein
MYDFRKSAFFRFGRNDVEGFGQNFVKVVE